MKQDNVLIDDPKNCIAVFSKEHFLVLKGISILFVVLGHLGNRYLSFPYFSPITVAGVSIFLICSGYGLTESFKKKGLKNYWPNKIIRVWLPSFFIISFFAVINNIGVEAWLKDEPFFLYGWYLKCQFVCYILFFVFFLLFKNKKLIVIFSIISSIVVLLTVKNQMYAEQAFSFTLGVIISLADVKNWLVRVKKSRLSLILAALLGICAMFFTMRHVGLDYYFINNTIIMLFELTLAVSIILVSILTIKIKLWKVFIPLGKIAFMTYLLNNFIFAYLSGRVTVINVLISIVITGLASALLTILFDKIYLGYTKIVKGKINGTIKYPSKSK